MGEHVDPGDTVATIQPQRAHQERQTLVEELFGRQGLPATFEGRLLRTREVALLFQVSERAVTDWARKGRISSVRTPGGHRRYPAAEVRALLAAAGQVPDDRVVG